MIHLSLSLSVASQRFGVRDACSGDAPVPTLLFSSGDTLFCSCDTPGFAAGGLPLRAPRLAPSSSGIIGTVV